MTRPLTRFCEQQRLASRRPRIIRGRRFALTVALAVAVLGCSSALAGADDTVVDATVYAPNAVTPDSVTLARLQSDPDGCPQYGAQSIKELGRNGPVVVSLAGPGPETGAWALSTVLGCLENPISLARVTGVTIVNADGSPELGSGSELRRADLASPSDFANTSEAPVISDLGSSNEYDRPWRGTGDYDYPDQVQESTPIDLEVFEGPLLTVTAHASATTIKAYHSIEFTSTVSPAGQPGLAYDWNFGGGAPDADSSEVAVVFTTPGTYAVTLQVTDTAGGGGGAGPIDITVNPTPAQTGSHSQSGNGTNPKATAPTGPQNSGGVTPAGKAGNKQPASTPKPEATPGAPEPVPSTPTSTSPGAGLPAPRPAAPLRGPSPQPAATAPHAPVVAGLLISDVTPVPAGESPLVHLASGAVPTAPPVREAIRASVAPALAASLAVVLLFGLGAGRELRGRRRWRNLGLGD